MGFNPSKFCCCLNILTNLGYGMMSAMVGGQLLSQMTDGAVSVVIGIIIVALVSLVVATFGMQIFQFYERYSRPPSPLLLSAFNSYIRESHRVLITSHKQICLVPTVGGLLYTTWIIGPRVRF